MGKENSGTRMSQIRGIFFDLGGTLFRYSGRAGGNGIRHLMEQTGLQLTREQVGHAWQDVSKKVAGHYAQQAYFLHKDMFRDMVTGFLDKFDLSPTPDMLETFHQMQLQGMVDNLPIRDECTTTLAALKEKGLYLSIVSNIDDDYLFPLVEKYELFNWLDHWTSSEEAQSCKPDPEIYRYCLTKAGLSAEEVLFVGDSLHHDVAGAAKVSMRSARIVEEGVTTPLTHGLEASAEPTYTIQSLDELLTIVEAANGESPVPT